MKVYAHRGYSGKYPENTMLAFRKAVETGCDGIELDVQLTKDGNVVVIHDEEIDRTTDGTGAVEQYSLEELQKFNANKTHPDVKSYERIPSFDEYCGWVKTTNVITDIELKTGTVYYRDLERKTLDIVKSHDLEKKVFFSSFNPLSVIKIKHMAPDIPCGLLVEQPIRHAGFMCRMFGIDYYHPGKKTLTEDIVMECHANGRLVNVWTITTREEAVRLKRLNVDGIFTNFPDLTTG